LLTGQEDLARGRVPSDLTDDKGGGRDLVRRANGRSFDDDDDDDDDAG